MPGAELGTPYTESSHSPAVLLTEGFVSWSRISLSLPLLQSVGALETGHRGLYLLEVRTVSGSEIGETKGIKKQGGKKKKKARRRVAKMGGKREGGRGQGKATLS